MEVVSLSADSFLQGNAYFKEGKYEAAVECYSRGMEADSVNVLLSANRAMAFLKLEKLAQYYFPSCFLVVVCKQVFIKRIKCLLQVQGGRGGLHRSHFSGQHLLQSFRPSCHSQSGFGEAAGGQARCFL